MSENNDVKTAAAIESETANVSNVPNPTLPEYLTVIPKGKPRKENFELKMPKDIIDDGQDDTQH